MNQSKIRNYILHMNTSRIDLVHFSMKLNEQNVNRIALKFHKEYCLTIFENETLLFIKSIFTSLLTICLLAFSVWDFTCACVNAYVYVNCVYMCVEVKCINANELCGKSMKRIINFLNQLIHEYLFAPFSSMEIF